MAVGPRLTHAAAAAAAGRCDTPRRLLDAAVRSGQTKRQTKPAVARALPPSQNPVVGTTLGNYLSPEEAVALGLSDELLALWGVVGGRISSRQTTLEGAVKKMKKLPKRKQLPHQRQRLRKRRRLQKKRWRKLPHQRQRLRERRRLQQELRLGLNQQWMHQHKTQKKKNQKHNQPPAQQPPPSALAMTPATTPAAAESEPATTVAATPSNNINNHKGSKTNFLTKITKSCMFVKKQMTSRLPRPIWIV
jgi:hypothetical protein